MKISTFRTFAVRLSAGAATLALAVTIGAPANAGSNTGGSSHDAPTHKQAAPMHKQTASKSSGHGGARWAYKGKDGPDRWGNLAAKYHACKAGMSQSPIDIADADGQAVTPIRFNYRLVPLDVVNNGHTVQVNYASGSNITIGQKNYDLLQFHFHTPSEHSVNGELSRQSEMLRTELDRFLAGLRAA